MRTLILPLLTLFVSSIAHAATLRVPGDFATIADAVAAAPNGSTILLKRPTEVAGLPGTHRIDGAITINHKTLTIRAEIPPRDVDSSNLDQLIDVWIDVPTAAATPGFKGAFVLQNGAKLTLENLRWKQPESDCDDNFDNDGNGISDSKDPYCEALGLLDQDTAANGDPIQYWDGDVRAVYAQSGTTLSILRCEMIGFSYATKGNVILAIASQVDIVDSRFHHNLGLVLATENGDWTEGEGIVHAEANSYVHVSNSLFAQGKQKYGGALWLQDSSLLVENGSAFDGNLGEDGGAIFLESSEAQILGSFFVSNSASVVPDGRLYTSYEGGAIYAEDSNIVVKNNVFLNNDSKDFGGAIFVRRAYNGDSAINPLVSTLIENNTFVANHVGIFGGASVGLSETADIKYVNNISFNEGDGALGAFSDYSGTSAGVEPAWPYGRAPNVHYNLFAGIDPDEVFTGGLSGLPINRLDNHFADPQFVYYEPGVHDDWRVWRFWLQPSSPAIDAGDPSIFDNNDPANISDIGAYGGDVPSTVDDDSDGWPTIYDCNDQDASVFPFAFELCNGVDDDCNGITDDRADSYYVDGDYDGYGSIDIAPLVLCPEQPPPPLPAGAGTYVNQGGDCDDSATLVNPGRSEFCDGIDNDCNGDVDDRISARPHYLDRDLDGFGNPDPFNVIVVQCPPAGYSPFPTDCDDSDPDTHPLIDFSARSHLPLANAPIERNEADRDPSFVADGIDEDCNFVDLCYVDLDRDGFGQKALPGRDPVYVEDSDMNCKNLTAFTAANADDCDDGDGGTKPTGTEVVGDGTDQNCDGHDECYADLDDDGWGSSDVVADDDTTCENDTKPTSNTTGDCNDDQTTGAEQFPTQIEVCDGIDNNCDGRIDEVTSAEATEFYLDADGDGFGTLTDKITACGTPLGYAAFAGDCDDDDNHAFPDNTEICDGVDNNCVGGIDEDIAIDVIKWYQDADGDGYGNELVFKNSCLKPETGGEWVKAGGQFDQDDTDPNVGPACTGCDSTRAASMAPTLLGLVALALSRRRRRR